MAPSRTRTATRPPPIPSARALHRAARPPTLVGVAVFASIVASLLFFPSACLGVGVSPPPAADGGGGEGEGCGPGSGTSSGPNSSCAPSPSPKSTTSSSTLNRSDKRRPDDPRCLAVDTDFNYLCTNTPDEARRAMTAEYLSGGSSSGGRGSRTSSKNKNNDAYSTSSYSSASVLAMPAELDLGVAQRIAGSEVERGRIRKVLKKMERYFKEEVLMRAEYEIARGRCKNHHELCAFWASVGECESNRGFMLSSCAASCRLCMLQHTNTWLE